ncbi:hypothetical protein C0J52_05312 [Blattella germanica]|nr:hypothetical protein C0J52_05312 [Blattella germanica]
MSEFSARAKCDLQDDDSSYEDAATTVDGIYSDQFGQNSAVNTNSSSRREKTASGFFSFLRWFRKGKDDEDDEFEDARNGESVVGLTTATAPSSPEFIRNISSSCGSIDTIFSTATVSSFAFVAPTAYRPFGSASQPEKRIAAGPDTDTYRNRLLQRDRIRELDRNLTLKKKYRLFGSETTLKSGLFTPDSSPAVERKIINRSDDTSQAVATGSNPGSRNSTFGRKKRKAPDPPDVPKQKFNDNSLPNTLEKHNGNNNSNNSSMENGEPSAVKKTRHRRTVSESAKDKKAGAYCHVRGKRKAPQPPSQSDQGSSTLERFRNQFPSFGRKKRPAPQPPEANNKKRESKKTDSIQSYQERSKSTVSQLSPEEKERLIANIAKLKAHADRKSMNLQQTCLNMDITLKTQEQVVCNDSLKLERGVLKPNKELPKADTSASENKAAPVSPRPWYKRSLTNKEGLSGLKRDIFKSLEKKKDREKEKDDEWMPEAGIPRVVTTNITSDGNSCSSTSNTSTSNRFNIFARLDRSDDKKKEGDKRKSQISMLANISELDREAAEIVQKEQAREQALMAAHDARFYSFPDVPPMMGNLEPEYIDEENENVEVPKRSSARELISLFNAIGNVTKVTVNSTFFSKEGSGFFSKEGTEKRFSFKSSRSREIYEANKSRRHHSPSPSIPTIAEQSESASSVATTPASTLNPNSNRNSQVIPIETTPSSQVTASGVVPDALQQAKKITIWTCPRCTLENPRWKITCDACGRWRPSITEEKPDVTKSDQPFQRPTSPLHDVKKPATNKVQDIKMELSKRTTGINWEEEIKHYLPNNEPKSKKIDKTTLEKPVEKSSDDVKINSNIPINNSEQCKTTGKLNEEKKDPPTFIGGRLKQDKEKDVVKNVQCNSINHSSVLVNGLASEEPDVDEVRKARLAFFQMNSANNIESCNDKNADYLSDADKVNNVNNETNNDSSRKDSNVLKKSVDINEQQKLKEMLKEMKNSLPKRPKQTGHMSANKNISLKDNETVEAIEPVVENNIQDSHKHGAIKKVLQKTPKHELKDVPKSPNIDRKQLQEDSKSKLQNGTIDDDHKAEVILITKKTIYEDIKVKKNTGPKPMKVSTSVQTSSVMRKIDVGNAELEENSRIKEGKPPSGKYSNVPTTVDDLSSAGIKDGVLYTSLSKDARRIGTGTFELIRAKDFASIEATKTGVSTESSVVHVYANVPTSSSEPVFPKQTAGANISDAENGVLSSQPSTPPVSKQPPESIANKKNIVESEEVLKTQKETTKVIDVVQDAEKKPTVSSSDESSRGITSSDSGAAQRSSRATSEASNYSIGSISSGDYSEVERLTAQLSLPKGIADFKADLQAAPPEQNMNTLAINRLLRRLESAIAGGQHNQAAVLAKDLARLKISCSVTRQRRNVENNPATIMVEMYVEDKNSHQGPIPLQVVPTMTVAQLKQKVEQEFEIPSGVQRWILGKMLASDDTKTLQEHNVSSNGCPMFLYLVAPDGEQDEGSIGAASNNSENQNGSEPVAQAPAPVPPPQPDRPGGWYYNDEDDRYSFCEDTESEVTEDDEDDDEEEEDPRDRSRAAEGDRLAMTAVNGRKDDNAKVKVEEEEDDEDEEDEEDDDNGDGIVGASALVIQEKPVVLQAPLVSKPFVKQTPQFLKTNVGLQTPEASSSNVHRTAQQPRKESWKCPLCTLVNSPTRPGCAACTTERPLNYIVPVDYRANEQELQRMKFEQQVDNDLQQAFECSVCFVQYNAGEGVVLRECLHTFCRTCLANTVQFNEEAELVPAELYEQHLAKSVTQAENKIGNAFHCKTPDCRGWCIFEDNVNEFRCPVCRKTNCLTCQGKGDTTGGCQCGVNGVKCHPRCNYCH